MTPKSGALPVVESGPDDKRTVGSRNPPPSKPVSGYDAFTLSEMERRRLARELHDGPCQTVVQVGLRLEICRRMLQAGISEGFSELDRVIEMVRSLAHDLRLVLYDLRPVTLDEQGLEAACEQLARAFQKSSGILTQFEVEGRVPRLEPAVETSLYRVFQECLNNVRKHAEASRVHCRIEQRDGWLLFRIRDDGKGFEVHRQIRGGGFGMKGMVDRMRVVGGTIEWISAGGAGTTVTFGLPLPPGTA